MWLGLWWEKKNGRSKASLCIWIQFVEGIYCFMKNDIPGDIDPTTSHIKTLEPLMKITIPKEYTLLGVKLELVFIEWAKVWPTCTSKGVHACVVWFFLEKCLKSSGKAYDFGRELIDDICGSSEGLIQIFERHVCMGKE
jgi:hypothetical protein